MPPRFTTPLTLTGPWRTPRNLLVEQTYAGHTSIHDDETAGKLGLKGGAVEGPTHFSQFEPLLVAVWGDRWFSQGCISAHFQSICAEGDEVQAAVEVPGDGAGAVRVTMAKRDGSQVLVGTASVGPDHPASELDRRLAAMKAPEHLVILDQLAVGQRGRAPEHVRMGFTQHMGDLYPFSLERKLATITEVVAWHTPQGGPASPWGRAVIPFEMVPVLTQYTSEQAGFRTRQPSVGLYLDMEVRLLDGPLFVDEPYVLEREVVALSESRRTESWWTRTTVRDEAEGRVRASVLIHHGVFKESYPGYPADRLAR